MELKRNDYKSVECIPESSFIETRSLRYITPLQYSATSRELGNTIIKCPGPRCLHNQIRIILMDIYILWIIMH